MAVTIKDIAKLAEVSITTVSMILNKKDKDISEQTRQRVLSIIKEYNYAPSSIARSMVTKKTKIIGLMVPDITNLYFSDMARAIEDTANELGYNIVLCNTDDDQSKEIEYINILKEKSADGIIFVSAVLSNHDAIVELSGNGSPVVVLDRILEGENLKAVYFENTEGGHIAAKHLIEKGHKKIGCITGPLKNKSAKDRYEGYLKALKEAGICPDKEWVYEGDYKLSSGEKGIKTLLKSGVTAVFVCNDIMAYGVYKAANQLELNIPEDISLVGYDDLYMSEVIKPPLTTIYQPRREMGSEAVKMIIKMIEGEAIEDGMIRFDPLLIERESVREAD